jgi:hypothetical protein
MTKSRKRISRRRSNPQEAEPAILSYNTEADNFTVMYPNRLRETNLSVREVMQQNEQMRAFTIIDLIGDDGDASWDSLQELINSLRYKDIIFDEGCGSALLDILGPYTQDGVIPDENYILNAILVSASTASTPSTPSTR